MSSYLGSVLNIEQSLDALERELEVDCLRSGRNFPPKYKVEIFTSSYYPSPPPNVR